MDKTVEIKRNSRRIFKLLLNTCVVKTNRGIEDELKSCFYLNLKETFGQIKNNFARLKGGGQIAKTSSTEVATV